MITEKTIRALSLILALVLAVTFVEAATLTCQQISDSSLSIPQFSSSTVEIKCIASGGTVSSIQITPNSDPSTGLTISSTQTISSSISDQGSSSGKWSVTGNSPNTYTVSYTVSSDGTNSWTGASTTSVEVPASAQLTVEYVLPPPVFDIVVADTLDYKMTNIGGTTANNIKLKLYRNGVSVYNYSYPTTIEAEASASSQWTNETGFNESGTYKTEVYIGDVLHDSATVSVLTPGDSRNLTAGYHLISLKRVPDNSSTPAVLSSVSGEFSKLWRYNSTTQNFDAYDPSLALSFTKIKIMDVKTGYWIRMTSDDASLNETGTEPTTTNIGLLTGYNLIGFPSTTSKNVSVALSGIDGNYEKLWKWDSSGGQFKAYDPSLDPSFNLAFGQMNPGEGYWIKMTSTDTLTITN